MDLGMATAASPWDLALVVPRSCLRALTSSFVRCGTPGIHLALHPNCCHGHLGGYTLPRPESESLKMGPRYVFETNFPGTIKLLLPPPP